MKMSIPLLVLVLLFVAAPGIAAQKAQSPTFPADIQKIMQKLQRGEELTDAEQEQLDKWSEEMDKRIEQLEKNSGKGDEGKASPLGGEAVECPKAKTIKSLPTQPPEFTAYVALARNLATKYGTKAGEAKARLDTGLQAAPKVKGGDVGAVLAVAQAGSAAAYAAAQAIVKDPLNFMAANNLGVILTGMEDYSNALSVLLYADKMRPNVPLVQVNIGWVYFDIGDQANAKKYFQKALQFYPDFSGAHNGLGLLAECEGNHLEAMAQFREAFKTGFSAVGAVAYRAARQAAADSGNSGNQSSQPISDQKETGGNFKVPQPPIPGKPVQAPDAKTAIEQMVSRIDQRSSSLQQQLIEVSARIRSLYERSVSDPNALVLNITFDKQLFLFQDISELLLGENSQLGQALKTTQKEVEAGAQAAANAVPDFMLAAQKNEEHVKRLEQLVEEMKACGDNDPCQKAVEKKMDQLRYEMEQEAYRVCRKQKDMLESIYTHQYKGWKAYHDELGRTLEDYVYFTTPVIADVWAPALNEFMNLFREGHILSREKSSLGMGANLPGIAENIAALECKEPEPPETASSDEGGDVQKKGPKPCPFKKPFTLKLVVVSMELDCEHVKIEGGEGLVGSFKRDFTKHETTIGIGVGANAETELGGGSAKMMIEITGSGNSVSDVAFRSSVSGKLGGDWTGASIEGELGGQISLESGPSVTFDTSTSFGAGGWGASLPGS